MFWSIKYFGGVHVLGKLTSSGFRVTSLSTYDFSTLYTTLPYNLIKEKLLDLFELVFNKIFNNEVALYLACKEKKRFSLLQTIEDIKFGLVKMYVKPYRISWIIFTSHFEISFTDKLLVITMGTNCTPL